MRRGRERRVGGLTVYDVVRSDDGCGLTVVECEHPSAHTNHQQVYSAVALTEKLCSGASDGPAERAIDDISREADDVAAHEELQSLAVERGEGAGEVEASAGEAEPETERQPEAAQAEEQAAPCGGAGGGGCIAGHVKHRVEAYHYQFEPDVGGWPG